MLPKMLLQSSIAFCLYNSGSEDIFLCAGTEVAGCLRSFPFTKFSDVVFSIA